MKRAAIPLACIAMLFFGQAIADDFNRTILPIPDQPFKGKIGLRPADSVKDFPKEVSAPKDAPNILLILTDDVGFGASSTFGGPGKSGQATLSVDGKKVGGKNLPRTIGYRMSLDETLDIGENTGTPVSEDYQVPFEFTGTLEKVTINISEEKLTQEPLRKYREGRAKAALAM